MTCPKKDVCSSESTASESHSRTSFMSRFEVFFGGSERSLFLPLLLSALVNSFLLPVALWVGDLCISGRGDTDKKRCPVSRNSCFFLATRLIMSSGVLVSLYQLFRRLLDSVDLLTVGETCQTYRRLYRSCA